MKLEVKLNDEKNGVELLFDEQPSEILSERIETLGFKHSYNSFLKWYAPQHPALVEYARALEKALFEGNDFLSSITALLRSFGRKHRAKQVQLCYHFL